MSQNVHTSIITTVSGICGGVGKAISSKPILLDITLSGTFEVALYAAVSAVVGYGVKLLIDRIKRSLRK
jgi:hypothetical protein